MEKKPPEPPEIPEQVHFIEEGDEDDLKYHGVLPAFVSHAPLTEEQEKHWREYR